MNKIKHRIIRAFNRVSNNGANFIKFNSASHLHEILFHSHIADDTQFMWELIELKRAQILSTFKAQIDGESCYIIFDSNNKNAQAWARTIDGHKEKMEGHKSLINELDRQMEEAQEFKAELIKKYGHLIK